MGRWCRRRDAARRHWPLRALALALLLNVIALTGVAQARVGHNGRGQRLSYQPPAVAQRGGQTPRAMAPASTASPDGCTLSPCLTYGLGPVMRSAAVTPFYWHPASAPAYPSGYTTTISRFFTDVAADSGLTTNFYSTLTQYYDTVGGGNHPVTYAVSSGAPVTDTDAYPTAPASSCTSPYGATRPCVTDVGVQNELASYLSAHSLPSSLGREYVVYLPPGVDVCFDGAGTQCSGNYFCGYHSYLVGTETEYAVEPDNSDPVMGASCGAGWVSNVPAMTTLNTTSHEVSESVTDPEMNAWFDPVTGNENGDNCAWSFVQGDGAGSLSGDVSPGQTNNTINGDGYILQAEWDNSADTCSLMAQPTASFTDSSGGTADTGAPVAFDAGGSTVPAGRTIGSYQWSFGDGTIASGATPSHAFALPQGSAPQTFAVTLTITDSAGQHSSVSRSVAVALPDEPPVAAFVAPVGAVAGTAVNFDGSPSTDLDGSIASYSWDFGDGGSASGATPSHVFAAAGTYSVTLIIVDSAGKSAQLALPVVVGAAPLPPPGPAPSSGSLVSGTPLSSGVTHGLLPGSASGLVLSASAAPSATTSVKRALAHRPKKKKKKKKSRKRRSRRRSLRPARH